MEHLLEQYQSYIDLSLQYGVSYLLKIIFALLVFFIGKRIARCAVVLSTTLR